MDNKNNNADETTANEKFVSLDIIVPCHNNIKFIKRLIESFKSQKNQDFNIIWVDDASDDGSVEVAQMFGKELPNFHFYKMPSWGSNGGARNYGVKNSTGKYIWFVDSDDYLYDENATDNVIKALKSNKDLYKFGFATLENGKLQDSQNIQENIPVEAAVQLAHAVWTSVFKRTLFPEFPERQILEDSGWYILLCDKIQSLGIVNKRVYVYNRDNPSAITNTMVWCGNNQLPLLKAAAEDTLRKQGMWDRFPSDSLRNLAYFWDIRTQLTKQYTQVFWYNRFKQIYMSIKADLFVH